MDSAKVEAIAGKYLDSLYRIAVNYCKNTEDAGDAVQNAFLKLMKTKNEFTDDDHIYRWMIKVTVNECKSMWRIFSGHKVVSLDELMENGDNGTDFTDDSSEKTIRARELWDAITQLPSKYSIIIHLYYYEGYSVNEISQILKITPTNVQTRLMRGRKKLKSIIPEGDY